MITVLLPLGDFPFFPQACVRNIKETTDVEIEVVFLTNNATAQNLKGCKVLVAPIQDSSRGIHLKLLDWAVRQPNITDRLYVQHCDMFWSDKGWLENMLAVSEPAVMPAYGNYAGEFKYRQVKYSLDDKRIVRTHDFSGLYDKSFVASSTFMWGTPPEVSSAKVLKAIEDNRFRWAHENRNLTVSCELDGSDALSLELAIEGRTAAESPVPTYFHSWDLFGLSWAMRRTERVIRVDRTFEKSLRGIQAYSWATSHYLDKDLHARKIFPWSVLQKILPKAKKPLICDILDKYKDTDNVLGDKEDKTETVIFTDQRIDVRTKKIFI